VRSGGGRGIPHLHASGRGRGESEVFLAPQRRQQRQVSTVRQQEHACSTGSAAALFSHCRETSGSRRRGARGGTTPLPTKRVKHKKQGAAADGSLEAFRRNKQQVQGPGRCCEGNFG